MKVRAAVIVQFIFYRPMPPDKSKSLPSAITTFFEDLHGTAAEANERGDSIASTVNYFKFVDFRHFNCGRNFRGWFSTVFFFVFFGFPLFTIFLSRLLLTRQKPTDGILYTIRGLLYTGVSRWVGGNSRREIFFAYHALHMY